MVEEKENYQMIPKKIHYCWFGGNPLTDDAKRYIQTWREYCPDYEIIEWNESNFDVNENTYCREAYAAKKWAFVSDYVRLKVLYEYGGIYMDTDVEVCKNLDFLLNHGAVSGYESEKSIPTGTIAARQGHEWIKFLLDDYNNRHFSTVDGKYDLTTNVETITKLTKEKYGIVLDGKKIEFGDNAIVLPFDYLCAKTFWTGEIIRTVNTFTIHHFSGSWLDANDKEYNDLFRCYYRKFKWIPLEMVRSKLAMLFLTLKTKGVVGVLQWVKRKLCDA